MSLTALLSCWVGQETEEKQEEEEDESEKENKMKMTKKNLKSPAQHILHTNSKWPTCKALLQVAGQVSRKKKRSASTQREEQMGNVPQELEK